MKQTTKQAAAAAKPAATTKSTAKVTRQANAKASAKAKATATASAKQRAPTPAQAPANEPKPSARTAAVAPAAADSPTARIDARIAELPDWRGKTLARVRSVIRQAVPGVTEEWKWRGVPVWSHHGMLCTGETYKDVVKVTFAKGASLADPARLFNASLDGNTRRAIDLREGDTVNERALHDLVRAAAALNASKQRR